uniref:acid phosphatase n=1 Tax=Megaselia scalaris TaxID=36166 RepID=T1H3C6_MEGSC
MSNTKDLSVLFVCIASQAMMVTATFSGNSCRSPMAEAVLKSLAAQKNLNWKIDSAALREWNVGRSPEPRCIKVLAENNLHTDHIGRQITDEDFHNFDYIFGMDSMNIRYLSEIKPDGSKASIELLGKYATNSGEIIEDPYFVGTRE